MHLCARPAHSCFSWLVVLPNTTTMLVLLNAEIVWHPRCILTSQQRQIGPYYTAVTLLCSANCRDIYYYLLCNVRVAAGGSNMQRCPSLTVNLVHTGTMLQKKGHHLHAAIYAGLCRDENKTETKYYNCKYICYSSVYNFNDINSPGGEQ